MVKPIFDSGNIIFDFHQDQFSFELYYIKFNPVIIQLNTTVSDRVDPILARVGTNPGTNILDWYRELSLWSGPDFVSAWWR